MSASEHKKLIEQNENVMICCDSIAKRYRQITTAVADGTVAALSAIDYLRTEAV